MPATLDQQDERLVELLDEALCELRSGRPLDTFTWQARHPELGQEGAALLATLVRFATSVDDWRQALPASYAKSPVTAGGTAIEASSPLPGPIGRYAILSRVGSGAMGTVYRAHDPQLDRLVAVKVPRMDRMPKDKQKYTERFLREARHAASVRHPHVCPIYDAGQQGECPYVVMAYVEGEPLDERLCREGRFDDVSQAVRLGIQVARALEAIHGHGIIHRDLKPGNILLDRSGQALLTDFGLARDVEPAEQLTMDGIIVGTPSYMSPEQAAGENSTLGPASDLYSLGVVMYEMLTGKLPFRGSIVEVLRRIIVETPVPAKEQRPDVAPQLSDLVMKALAKNPKERFLSAKEFAEALATWQDSTAATERHTPPATDTIPDSVVAAGPLSPDLPARRKFPTRRWAAGSAAAILLVATGFAVSKRDSQNEQIADVMPAAPAPIVVPRVKLTGDIEVTVAARPEKADLTTLFKTGVPISTPGQLPLRNGKYVRLEARLNRPAFIYLLWVDTDGSVLPLYPWDAEHSRKLWNAPLVATSDQPVQDVQVPSMTHPGFKAVGVPGFQTVLLLARSTPLKDEIDLHALLGNLPAMPLVDVPWLGDQKRGLCLGAAADTEDPWLCQLEERLQPHFELIRILRFAQTDAPTNGTL